MPPLLLGAALIGLAGKGLAGFAQETRAESEDDFSEVGLNGIIGEPASPKLDTQFLARDLPESWKDWAESLDEDMLIYLFPEELDVQGQRELIAKMRERVAVMRRAIADVRYRPIRDRLVSLAEPLDRHLTLSTAVLESLELGVVPVSKERRHQAFSQLQEATKTLNAALSNRPDQAAWNKDFEIPQLLGKLSDMSTPVPDLRKHLDDILSRLENRDEFSADQLRFLRSDAFWPFHKSAAKIQAILEWEDEPATKETLRETLRDLAVAFVSLDVNQLITHSQELQLAWDRLILLNPKNEPLFAFLKEHHFSDNLHAQISEDLMQEIVYDRRTDPGPISETIMGAQVYGNQVTDTEVTLDFLPSPNEALMAVKVAGNTNANTVAVQRHIKVYAQGSSQFWAVKKARFNGFRFQPDPAEVAVNAATLPYDANTPISCLPVLGTCMDNLIVNQALARRSEAEAMARQRVADRLVPELNKGINDALAEANAELEDNIYRRLANNNLYPVGMRTATTDAHMLTHTLIRNRAELGGGPAPTLFDEPTGANFHIHESLLNNIADRMNLAGREMTEKEVREEMSRFIFELTGRTVDLSDDEDPMADPNAKAESKSNQERQENEAPQAGSASDRFVFDKTTPIRFQIQDNQVQMTVRTALISAAGDEIPPHDIMIPLQFEMAGEEILITKGRLVVNQADTRGNPAQNLVMGQRIGEAIPEGRQSRLLTLEPQEGKTLTLRMERMKALNGWLSLWALPEKSPTPAPTP